MIESKIIHLEGLDGRLVRIEQLASKDAMRVALRISNLMGRALREAAASGGDAVEVVAAGALLEHLDEELLWTLVEIFEKKTTIENTPGAKDFVPIKQVTELVFGSGQGTARRLAWLFECVEFSCAPFFAEARARMLSMRRQITSVSPSQSTSAVPGSSTESQPRVATGTA